MIVSDSTTLIILNNLKKLDLLKVFNKVYIPKKVYEKVNFKNDFFISDFIKVKNVKKNELYFYLTKLLDEGEIEAITLAKELDLPLIINEKKGRKIVKNLNIKIIGLLGILYLNYKKGFITKEKVKSFLDDAISNGYRISQKLLEEFWKNLKGI